MLPDLPLPPEEAPPLATGSAWRYRFWTEAMEPLRTTLGIYSALAAGFVFVAIAHDMLQFQGKGYVPDPQLAPWMTAFGLLLALAYLVTLAAVLFRVGLLLRACFRSQLRWMPLALLPAAMCAVGMVVIVAIRAWQEGTFAAPLTWARLAVLGAPACGYGLLVAATLAFSPPEDPPPTPPAWKPHSFWRFSLAALALCTTVIGITLAAGIALPPLGFALACVILPAAVRTHLIGLRTESQGEPQTQAEMLGTYLGSCYVSFFVLLVACIAGTIAGWAGGLCGAVLHHELKMGSPSDAWFAAGSSIAGVLGGGWAAAAFASYMLD